MLADWRTDSVCRTGWGPDWLTGWLTNLPTEGLTGCLVDWRRAREQSFPTCSPPRRISAGERCLVPFAVFTVWSPAVGVQPRFISTLGPETPLQRPPLISNRDFLSLPLSPLPFLSLLYAHRHAGWGHFERVNRCRLICPGLSDIARVMYLMWSLFSSNKRIKN